MFKGREEWGLINRISRKGYTQVSLKYPRWFDSKIDYLFPGKIHDPSFYSKVKFYEPISESKY